MHFFKLMLHFYKETKFTYCFRFFINLVGLYKPRVIAVGEQLPFFILSAKVNMLDGWF